MKRASLTLIQKIKLLLAQEGKCAKKSCRKKLEKGDIEFDHTHALGLNGTNELDNWQALCLECHNLKTNGRKHCRLGADKFEIAKAKRIACGGKTKTGKKINSKGFTGWRKFNGTLVRKET